MTGQTENIYFTALIKHTHVGCCWRDYFDPNFGTIAPPLIFRKVPKHFDTQPALCFNSSSESKFIYTCLRLIVNRRTDTHTDWDRKTDGHKKESI